MRVKICVQSVIKIATVINYLLYYSSAKCVDRALHDFRDSSGPHSSPSWYIRGIIIDVMNYYDK